MKELADCPICHSPDRTVWYLSTPKLDGIRYQVVICRNCGHGYVANQPSWEEMAPYYSAEYSPYQEGHGAQRPDDEAVEEARRTGEFRHVAIRPGMRILDIGCGSGYFMKIASRLGAEVEGVEPSDHGLRTSQGTGLPVFHGTIEEYTKVHGDRKFDLITANHVLEHTPDPVETLRVAARHLNPGGMLWISVPNAANPYSLKLKDEWHSAMVPIHLMQFNPGSLAEAGRKAGLVVRSVSTYSLPSAVAATFRMFLRRRFLIPQKLTSRLGFIDDRLAPKMGGDLDRRREGEAVLAEFTLPA